MADIFKDYIKGIAPGMCRLSMNGKIAIKCKDGSYKTYNEKTGVLTNCSNFVFDVGQDFFFIFPTMKVEVGDIIISNSKPLFVKEVKKNSLVVVDYEDTSIKEILPERHMFMGNMYFYPKIVSFFNMDGKGMKSKDTLSRIMKFKMMMSMFNGNNGMDFGMGNMFNTSGSNNMMTNMMQMYFMQNMMGDMFGDMFNGENNLFDGMFEGIESSPEDEVEEE